MTTDEYVRLWIAIDRATDPLKTPLMRTRHKAFLMTAVRRLSPGNADLISRQVDRINAQDCPLRKHYERMELMERLLKEVRHDT